MKFGACSLKPHIRIFVQILCHFIWVYQKTSSH